MKEYEIKRYVSDPFDLACSDCEVHDIPVWEPITIEGLREVHVEHMADDANLPDWQIEEFKAEGEWEPTNPDFDAWLAQQMEQGYVREIRKADGVITECTVKFDAFADEVHCVVDGKHGLLFECVSWPLSDKQPEDLIGLTVREVYDLLDGNPLVLRWGDC